MERERGNVVCGECSVVSGIMVVQRPMKRDRSSDGMVLGGVVWCTGKGKVEEKW